MRQLFSRPDWYCARCGDLSAVMTEQRVPGAPAFMRGLRVLFVSDVHVLPRTTDGQLAALAEKLAATAPDLMLLGGDYADRAGDAARLFAALGAVRPRLGCYGVLGNNDAEAWTGQRELRRLMAKAGCRLLVNQSARIPLDGGTLIVAGVDEHLWGRPDVRGLYPKRGGDGLYRVLLSHYPVMPAVKPDLMLSGHTHGGQFNLLGLTPFALGFERFKRKYLPSMAIAGLREADGMKLLVSKGIGASRLQLRVGVRPEVNLITFD